MASRPDEPVPVIPDDAAELDADRLAWLAEERSRRRRRQARRLVFTRRWDRFGISGPIVAIALLGTSVVAALAVVFTPRPDPLPEAAPLAAVPELAVPAAGIAPDAAVPAVDTLPPDDRTATTGPTTGPTSGPAATTGGAASQVAGLRLPDVPLQAESSTVRGSSLRPALIAVVPTGCACERSLTALLQQAHEFRLRLWLLGSGPPAMRAELIRLDEETGGGAARWAVDPSGTLSRALLARGLTAVLVRSDGVIHQIRRDLARDGRVPALELHLARLVPGAGRISTR